MPFFVESGDDYLDKLMELDEMSQLMSEQRQSPGRAKIYREQADAHKGEMLAADLDRKIAGLRRAIDRQRVPWDDVEEVQRRTLEYLTACKESQTIPTVSGLAVFGLGYTRQALNQYLRQHSTTKTANFLLQVKDAIADTLETAALNRNTDSIMSIFILKNDHERADRVQLEPVTHSSPLEELSRQELEERIRADVVEEYD